MVRSIAMWTMTIFVAGILLSVSGSEVMARKAVSVMPEKSQSIAAPDKNAIPMGTLCSRKETKLSQAFQDGESCLQENCPDISSGNCVYGGCPECDNILAEERSLFIDVCLNCENIFRYHVQCGSLLNSMPNENPSGFFTGVCYEMQTRRNMINSERETRKSIIEKIADQ